MVAETATRTLTYQQAINEALQIAMREDPTVILLGEDIAGGAMVDHLVNDDAWGGPMGVTKGLVQEFGRNRVLDTPITEAGFIGAAVGAAAAGLRPVAELMFVDFFGCHGSDLRPGRQTPLYVRREGKCPVTIRTQIGPASAPPVSIPGVITRFSPTCPASSASCHRRRQTPRGSAERDSRRRSGDVFENKVLYGTKATCPRGMRVSRSAWPTSSARVMT